MLWGKNHWNRTLWEIERKSFALSGSFVTHFQPSQRSINFSITWQKCKFDQKVFTVKRRTLNIFWSQKSKFKTMKMTMTRLLFLDIGSDFLSHNFSTLSTQKVRDRWSNQNYIWPSLTTEVWKIQNHFGSGEKTTCRDWPKTTRNWCRNSETMSEENNIAEKCAGSTKLAKLYNNSFTWQQMVHMPPWK